CSSIGDAMLLATRELTGSVIKSLCQTESAGDFLKPGSIDLLAGKIQGQADVFGGGQGRDQVESLEDKSESVAAQGCDLFFIEFRKLGVADIGLATGGAVEGRHAVHKR